MTTEPKFIPEEAVKVTLADNAAFNVRMIDCVATSSPARSATSKTSSPAWW